MADTEQMIEGAPISTEVPPPSTEQAATPEPTAGASAPPDPFETARSVLDGLPDDVIERLADEHPRLKEPLNKRTRTLIDRKEAERQQAEAARQAAERDLILVDENHPDHFTYLERYGTAMAEAARQNVATRAALRDENVRKAANVDVAFTLDRRLRQHEAFGRVTPEEWDAAMAQPQHYADALAQTVKLQVDREVEARIAALAPAIKAQTLDEYRAGLPNPDAGRSVTNGRDRGPLTPEAIRAMDPRDFVKNADAIWAAIPSGRRD